MPLRILGGRVVLFPHYRDQFSPATEHAATLSISIGGGRGVAVICDGAVDWLDGASRALKWMWILWAGIIAPDTIGKCRFLSLDFR